MAPENKEFIGSNKVQGSVVLASTKNNLRRLSISLDNYLPSVFDQGSQGSCTAFAVAEALSIRDNYINGRIRSKIGASNLTVFSPTYLWVLGNRNSSDQEPCGRRGISYSTAFSCMFNFKLVYWNTYPYPKDEPALCEAVCPKYVLDERIKDRNFAFDDVILDTNVFKDLLLEGYPICIATNLETGFYDALYNRDLKGRWLKKSVRTEEQHAMVVVDFNDDIRCFKVLDSHGTNVADGGFIWLSYDLVNHNLDDGVVFGCYTMSFDKEISEGPTQIHYISSTGAPALKIVNEDLSNSAIAGTVVDSSGTPVPGVTIHIKGAKSAVQSTIDGKFYLQNRFLNEIILNAVGYESQEVRIGYNSDTIYENNFTTDWTKAGYFRTFNGVRFGVLKLNKRNRKIILSIVDASSKKELVTSIEMTVGDTIHFVKDKKKFIVSLEKIQHKGNLFNLVHWHAAILSYKLNTEGEKLTQYF